MVCQHLNRIGDNYGETCANCGTVLRGQGYWAQSQGECHHEWLRHGDHETCVYCESERQAMPSRGTM